MKRRKGKRRQSGGTRPSSPEDRGRRPPSSLIRAPRSADEADPGVLFDIIENQLRDDTPPAVREALERLMAGGESRDEAIRYIASAFSVELFEILQAGGRYDEARYVANLRALPTLPFDADEDTPE